MRTAFSSVLEGQVHPDIKLRLIKAEECEKHIIESFTKIHQRITKV